jgi:cellulose synthase/poly-beta-1,6-N-acetylglucosamine synthase-like glycosyltransferase
LRRTLVRHTIMQLFLLSISLALFVVYAALILYYAISWRSIPTFLPPTTNKQQPTITVIIPARNEAENIKACLDSICNQLYPKELYEVIVVDDHSTDDTASIVQQYQSQNVKLITLSEHIDTGLLNSYKKKALEIAIAQSTGEIIVTTDADCYVKEKWLQTIASFYQQTNAAFIAMPVAYNCSNNFIEIFQALDFMTLQGITGASVYKRIHSMCNGANLAYTKKAFEEVNGFKGIDNIASGDDMLLMHKIYKQHPGKIFFLKSKEVIVQTAPMKTLKDFLNQRIRWASKADKYDDKRIFGVLLLVYLFNILLLILPVLGSLKNYPLSIINYQFSLLQLWLTLVICKTIIELIFLFPVASFFNKKSLLWLFPLAQPFHILYTVIAGWLGKFGTYQWKERKVK